MMCMFFVSIQAPYLNTGAEPCCAVSDRDRDRRIGLVSRSCLVSSGWPCAPLRDHCLTRFRTTDPRRPDPACSRLRLRGCELTTRPVPRHSGRRVWQLGLVAVGSLDSERVSIGHAGQFLLGQSSSQLLLWTLGAELVVPPSGSL
jgi:hypothetical protein